MRINVEIYTKSGNVIKVKLKEYTITKMGSKITKLEWKGTSNNHYLHLIDIDQIEAIVDRGISLW